MLGLEWQKVVAYIVNVIILFFFLRWLLYKPIRKFLDEREQRFKRRNEEIEQKEQEANTLKSEYEGKLRAADDEASSILGNSRQNANQRADEIIEDARRQAKDMLERARGEIAEERKTARLAMREEVADLAIGIASRVLEREVSQEDNQHIIDKFMSRERIS